MPAAVCWPNSKQIFQGMASTPRHLEWNKPELSSDVARICHSLAMISFFVVLYLASDSSSILVKAIIWERVFSAFYFP